MKTLAIFALAAIISNYTSAQLFVDLNAGYNSMNATENFMENNSAKNGYSLGLNFGYETENDLTYKAGLLFEYRQFLNDPQFMIIESHPVIHQRHYLGIPVQFGYTGDNKLFLSGYIGLLPAFIVSNNTVVADTKEVLDTEVDFPTIDVSGFATLGGGYNFGKFATSAFFKYQYSIVHLSESLSPHKFYGWTMGLEVKYYLNSGGE